MRKLFFLGLLFFCSQLTAQKMNKATKLLSQAVENQISIFGDFSTRSSEKDSSYSDKARRYIADSYKKWGLTPINIAGYIQAFNINEGRQINNLTSFLVNNMALSLHEEYYPLSYCAEIKDNSYPSLAIMEAGVPWFINIESILKGIISEDDTSISIEHYKKIHAKITTLAAKMKEQGATGLILYETSDKRLRLFDGQDNRNTASLPIIFITKQGWNKYFPDPAASYEIAYSIQIEPKNRIENNIIGVIDNKAGETIVFTTPYDLRTNSNSTIIMMELARQLQQNLYNKYNYIFINKSLDKQPESFKNEVIASLNNAGFKNNYRIHIGTMNQFNPPTLAVMGLTAASGWSNYFKADKNEPVKVEFVASNEVFKAEVMGTEALIYCFDGSSVAPENGEIHQKKEDIKLVANGMACLINKLTSVIAIANK